MNTIDIGYKILIFNHKENLKGVNVCLAWRKAWVVNININVAKMIGKAYDNDDFEVIRYLYLIGIDSKMFYYNKFNSSKSGSIKIVRYVYEFIGIRYLNFGSNDRIYLGCNDEIDVLDYLFRVVKIIKPGDRICRYNFRTACLYGHINVVKYMVEVMGIDRSCHHFKSLHGDGIEIAWKNRDSGTVYQYLVQGAQGKWNFIRN